MFQFIQFILGQTETANVLAGSGWDMAGTIYLLIGGLVSSGFAWGAKRLLDLINAKISNELLRGILGRLSSSVVDAVAMVNQTVRKEIESAKDPNSPGGTKITIQEKKQLYNAVWDALKAEYGGWDGIFTLLRKIGFGQDAAKAKINTMIEAAVNGQKKSANPDPS